MKRLDSKSRHVLLTSMFLETAETGNKNENKKETKIYYSNVPEYCANGVFVSFEKLLFKVSS